MSDVILDLGVLTRAVVVAVLVAMPRIPDAHSSHVKVGTVVGAGAAVGVAVGSSKAVV